MNYNHNYDEKEIEKNRFQNQIVQLEQAYKQIMTKEALQRYSNIKTANPIFANQLIITLAGWIESTQKNIITDDELKNILSNIIQKKRDIKITRK